MILDILQEIFYTLTRNKLRTFLTAFGVFWGIFLLILLLGLGEGLNKSAMSDFQDNVANTVWLWSRKTSVPYKGMAAGRWIRFNSADAEAMRQMDSVKYVAAENPVGSVNGGDTLIKYKKKYGNFGVFGIEHHFFSIKIGQDFRGGRKINYFDEHETRKIALIGTLVAERLFKDVSPIGEFIEINNISFKVVGLFYDPARDGQSSERVFIPLSVYQTVFGRGKSDVKIIKFTPEPGYDPFEIEKKVVALLKQRHIVAPEDRSAIRSWNNATGVQRATGLNKGIQAFIWFVGLGTLAAGVVGISNIMLITVKERTAEIGVKKALGARPLSIVSGLLFESVMITALAGYLGMVFGVGLLELISFLMEKFKFKNDYFLHPEVNFTVAISAIAILVSVGFLAGLVPAWKAARISPVEAMRAA